MKLCPGCVLLCLPRTRENSELIIISHFPLSRTIASRNCTISPGRDINVTQYSRKSTTLQYGLISFTIVENCSSRFVAFTCICVSSLEANASEKDRTI